MTENQKKQFILNTLYFVTAAAWIFFIVKFAVPYTLPFLAGLVIAFLLKPITVFLSKSLRIKRKGAAMFVTTVFYVMLAALTWSAILAVCTWLAGLAGSFPDFYRETILPILADAIEALSRLITKLVPNAADFIHRWFDSAVSALTGTISSVSRYLVSKGTQIAAKVPMFLMTVLFTILCSALISQDYSRVVSFLLRQLPPTCRVIFFECKDFVVNTLFRMGKAYLKIMSITFAELAAGFLLLRIENPVGMAVLVAILDILPLIGTGSVLIPWGILTLLKGDYPLGAGILILYGVITVVRNIMEPKIVGASIGLHPLVTILAMYAGLRLFGVVGVFLAPMTALLVKYLNEKGRIHLYK